MSTPDVTNMAQIWGTVEKVKPSINGPIWIGLALSRIRLDTKRKT
jgi:hypothetical protein